jgi:FAD/FMN-containing dehydrogenase
VVQPGIVLDMLNDQLSGTGLRFGPEPATHLNCTLGGMIGNNSCGATAQRTGKVVDNVAELEMLLYDGTRFYAARPRMPSTPGSSGAATARPRSAGGYGGCGTTSASRSASGIPTFRAGYLANNRDSLLPEHGFDIAGLLVGSESTVVTVLRARLKLVPVVAATPRDLFFRYPHDGGSFAQAANRCIGIGKCRQHAYPGGAVMCPSYQVTGEEEHSTRGRARLLFEMLDGHGDSPVTGGWRSPAVRQALDLCLSCKGCKTDSPPTWTWPPIRRSSSPTTGRAASGAGRAATSHWAGCPPGPARPARCGWPAPRTPSCTRRYCAGH